LRGSRFVFLSMLVLDNSGQAGTESIMWILVSPNNRRLGRAQRASASYDVCLESVLRLRERYVDLTSSTTTVESQGHWTWRVELDRVVVAISTRTYLRQQESDYSLHRFLEAVPEADVAPTARAVRIGRLPAAHGS
jgi:hypothetical protein